MHNDRNKGWTLIELLVIAAIMGIIAAIGIALVFHARQSAQDANARFYASEIYKVAVAHIAADKNNSLIEAEDCTAGYSAGEFAINGGAVLECSVQDDQGVPAVHVVSLTGRPFSAP